jgi:hypothetical protein
MSNFGSPHNERNFSGSVAVQEKPLPFSPRKLPDPVPTTSWCEPRIGPDAARYLAQ